MSTFHARQGAYLLTTDREKMDVVAIHDFLCNHSGWARGIPLEMVRRSLDHSLNFGLWYQDRQVGFARVISDFSTVAYLGDIYILEPHRGQGLSRFLMDQVMHHPRLQGMRRWILLTSTAPWLYQKYGFTNPSHPEWYMEKYEPSIYRNPS